MPDTEGKLKLLEGPREAGNRRSAKADYTVRWCKVTQEYVARSSKDPEVTGHSRDPGYALMALLTKVRELEATPAKKRRPSSWVSHKGQPVRFGAQSVTSGPEGEADATAQTGQRTSLPSVQRQPSRRAKRRQTAPDSSE